MELTLLHDTLSHVAISFCEVSTLFKCFLLMAKTQFVTDAHMHECMDRLMDGWVVLF